MKQQTSGIRERLLAQEVIWGAVSPGKNPENKAPIETFSKLPVFRGVQQCEVTYEEILLLPASALDIAVPGCFFGLIAMSGACCVWSKKFSKES